MFHWPHSAITDHCFYCTWVYLYSKWYCISPHLCLSKSVHLPQLCLYGMHPVCVFFGHMLCCVVTHECSLCLWSVVSLTSLFCLISMLMTAEPRKVARVAGIHSAALIKKASEQGRERTTEAEGGREGDSQEVGGVVRRRRRRKERMWKWKRQAWPRRNSVRISRKGKN